MFRGSNCRDIEAIVVLCEVEALKNVSLDVKIKSSHLR